MKAYMCVSSRANELLDKPGYTGHGLKLPYITKVAHPVFALEGEERWPYGESGHEWVEAQPGMVGQSQRGDKLYMIDTDGEAREIPVRVIALTDYVRFYEQFDKLNQRDMETTT